MKKLFIMLSIFISLFFFSSSNVKADSTVNITRDYSSLYENLDTILNSLPSRCTNGNYPKHFITYILSNYRFYCLKEDMSVSFNTSHFTINSNNNDYYYYVLNSDFSFPSSSGSTSATDHWYYILYSDFPISNNEISPIIFNYQGSSYTLEPGHNYNEVIDNLFNPTTPPDPHLSEIETLTSFYTLVIDKILYLVEIFSNNYIYLSLFVLVIIISSIYLFRRLL